MWESQMISQGAAASASDVIGITCASVLSEHILVLTPLRGLFFVTLTLSRQMAEKLNKQQK